MPLLFSYGSLQQDDVQQSTFGRLLDGQKDELIGYAPALVKIDDAEVAAALGKTDHNDVRLNGDPKSRVAGTVFEISDAELAGVDQYEAAFRYRRVAARLASGRETWVYVHAPQFDLENTFDILRRTPSVVDRLLRGTSGSWFDAREGLGTWSALDVIGHLVFGEETDWVPRARIILEFGEKKPFEPFDRFAMLTRFANWSLDQLLDRFAELRRENLRIVESWNLTADQLALPGRHPALGPVNLRQLLAAWVVHDLNHIGQIVRVMAKSYTDDVGPWRAYLSILNGPGT